MRRTVAIFFIFLLLPALNASASSINDSVSTAMDIINGFYAEAESLVGTVEGAEGPFKEQTLGEKKKTLSDLRSIGIAKSPSRSRYQRVRALTEGYMAGVISAVDGLKPVLGKERATRIDDIAAQLTSLMAFKLKALEETLRIEAYEKKGPRPVPLIDRERTPFDNPPDEPPGIWFR